MQFMQFIDTFAPYVHYFQSLDEWWVSYHGTEKVENISQITKEGRLF